MGRATRFAVLLGALALGGPHGLASASPQAGGATAPAQQAAPAPSSLDRPNLGEPGAGARPEQAEGASLSIGPAAAALAGEAAWLVWENRFGFVTGLGRLANDHAAAMAFDAAGRVLVTGDWWEGSGGTTTRGGELAISTPDGAKASLTFDGIPAALTADPAGHVFVAGITAATEGQILTKELAIEGAPGWSATLAHALNAGEHRNDAAVGVFFEPGAAASSVIVAGTYRTQHVNFNWDPTYVVAEYSSADGAPAWSHTWGGGEARGAAHDQGGAVAVTGTAGTVVYSVGGSQLCSSPRAGEAVAFDGTGAFYVAEVAAAFNGPGGTLQKDFRLTKYGSMSASGCGELWTRTWGTTGASEIPSRVVVARPYVLIAGNDSASAYGRVLKYDENGILQWSEQVSDPPAGLAADADANAYVVCGNSSRWRLTKLAAAAGAQVWQKDYEPGAIGGQSGQPVGLLLDAQRNVYVAGSAKSTEGSGVTDNWDIAVLKYTQLPDYDGDGIPNSHDNCQNVPNPTSAVQ